MHVRQLDNGNSRASLARVHFKPHNQSYIVATSSHSDCKSNEILQIDWLVLRVRQHGKKKYESLMPKLFNYLQVKEVLTPMSTGNLPGSTLSYCNNIGLVVWFKMYTSK